MAHLYTVTWQMDLYAGSPEDAAWFALEALRDPESITAVFDVSDSDGTTRVDLDG